MMKFKRKPIGLLAVALIFGSVHFVPVEAANTPWTSSNRIAISADGCPDADADDVGATPFTLAVLAKAGLQGNLVHYDFNNFLNYKRIEPANNRLWISAMGGQTRWGFDSSRFFDAAIDPDGAIAHLTTEINKSTASDPLYLILAGPMELIYQALEASDSTARQHVVLVSHHNYNEYFKARLWHRNIANVRELVPNIGYHKIPDQNSGGLKGTADSDFYWMRDHADANLNWAYTRVVAGHPDVSDAGMLCWLIGISGTDGVVTIAEMATWFGADEIPTNGGSAAAPAAPVGVTPDVTPPDTESIFQEVNGKVVIEAESVPLTDEWILDTTEAGYSGSGYVRWMPSWIGEISHQHRGVLTYKIRITTPGKYRMALRSSHKGAPERDKWNDCWTVMGLNPVNPYGITRKTYHSISQTEFDNGAGFTWHTTHDNYGSVASSDGHFSAPEYELEAGDHFFYILGRSGGYRIDKIHFFKEGVGGFKSDTEPSTPILPGSGTPDVNAGDDQTIYHPADSVTLQGTVADSDGGSITTQAWSQVSGPNTAVLSDINSLACTASGLIEGGYVFELMAIDDEAKHAADRVQITVIDASYPHIITTSLPDGEVGLVYNESLEAELGQTPYTWSVISGMLPGGLSLSGNTISGTPTTAGTYSMTFDVTDAASVSSTVALQLVIDEKVSPLPHTTIWSEDFEGATLGATSGVNQYLTGADIFTANGLLSKVVAAPAEFTTASGHAVLLSTGPNAWAGIQQHTSVTDLSSYPIRPGDLYSLSFDIFIPADLVEPVGGLFMRWKNADQTSNGPFDYTKAIASAGVHRIEYTGVFPADNGAGPFLPTEVWPFLYFDQEGVAATDHVYLDNIEFYIKSDDSVNPGDETGFDQFEADYQLTGGMLGDDDGDDQSNLYEFATGGNPTNGNDFESIKLIFDADGNARFCAPQRMDRDAVGLLYDVEMRTNLTEGTWASLYTNAVFQTPISGTTEFEEVQYRFWNGASTPQERFLRLKVLQN